MENHRLKLGAEVKDRVSGFRGTLIARTKHLHGDIELLIQPPVNELGELPPSKWFDEPRIEPDLKYRAMPIGLGED